jgi:[NiFe] hydrogenase assembly HybE family chaperone
MAQNSAGLYECGVCWTPYDPAIGDPHRGIGPDTLFEDLPDDWRCPQCDAMKIKFLRTEAPRMQAPDKATIYAVARRAYASSPEGVARALEDQMRRKAADGMAALPISNPRLRVEAIGFHQWRNWRLGILVTPWSMLLILSPLVAPEPLWPDGLDVEVELPSGRYNMIPAQFDAIGPALMLSLFSPMDAFQSSAEAKAAAKAALLELMTPPPQKVLDRRDLLRGARASELAVRP